jgi:hypothetical protein
MDYTINLLENKLDIATPEVVYADPLYDQFYAIPLIQRVILSGVLASIVVGMVLLFSQIKA